MTHTVNLYAFNEASSVTELRVSNDPLMFDTVVTMPLTEMFEWVFDERQVVWVRAEDGVGNLSESVPSFATKLPDYNVFLPLVVK